MPSLGAYLLALGNLLCALTWWICSLSAQLHVGPRWEAGCREGYELVVVVGGVVLPRRRSFCDNFESILLPLLTPYRGQLIIPETRLCQLLPFLVVDPCKPQKSNCAHEADIGSYWKKGKQKGEHASVHRGVLSLVGTRCEAAFSPLGSYCGLKV